MGWGGPPGIPLSLPRVSAGRRALYSRALARGGVLSTSPDGANTQKESVLGSSASILSACPSIFASAIRGLRLKKIFALSHKNHPNGFTSR